MAGAGREGRVRVGEERRRARHQEAQAARRRLQPRLGEQADVEGRHPHHHARARHQPHHLGGVEPRHEQHRRAAGQRRVGGDEQPVRVEDRQGVEQRVGGREAPSLDQRQRVGQEVVVGQHGALRAPRGAGRVQDRGEVARASRHVGEIRRLARRAGRKRAVSGRAQRFDAGVGFAAREMGQGVAARGVDDEQAGRGVADEVAELGRRVGGVERQVDGAGPHAREVERQGFGAFLGLHGDPVAGPHPERREGPREAARQRRHVAAGQDAPVRGLDQGPLGFTRRGRQARHEVVHHASSPNPAARAAVRPP